MYSRRGTIKAVLMILAVGAGVAARPAPAADVPPFDGEAALGWIVTQCDLGPRTPGSEANRELRRLILAEAARYGLRAEALCHAVTVPVTGDTATICNIVVSAGPPGGQRLWLGAHFDTRPVADHDPDPARRGEAIAGANDGASGTAVLLQLMGTLGDQPPPQGVDLLFFDGEDAGLAGSPEGFCLGSRRLAETWDSFGSPLAGGTPRGLVLLDMVGQRGLTIAQEQYSLLYARDWTERVFARAADLGLSAFVAAPGPAVYDDHVPFLQRGIPAVDLIDFSYEPWHTTADTPEQCSAASLAQVGRLVLDLIYRP